MGLVAGNGGSFDQNASAATQGLKSGGGTLAVFAFTTTEPLKDSLPHCVIAPRYRIQRTTSGGGVVVVVESVDV